MMINNTTGGIYFLEAFYGNGPYGDGYGLGVGGAINSTQQVLRVQINLYDARSGQLVWSGNSAEVSGYASATQPETLREAVSKAMQGFPVRLHWSFTRQ